MKIILILLLSSITFGLSGQVTERKALSPAVSLEESFRQDLVAGKTRIDEAIAPWQKEKLASVSERLSKTRLSNLSGNNPVDMVKKLGQSAK